MKILYIADGRSPNARSWIGYFVNAGHEVHLVSTFLCQPMDGLASLVNIPVALSEMVGAVESGQEGYEQLIRRVIPVGLRTRLRQLVAPMFFPGAVRGLQEVIRRVQPDVMHAMRIPYEGMITALAVERRQAGRESRKRIPLLVSVWGNDFTLHARSTPIIARYTRQTLETCNALHIDCQRDLNLARKMGFAASKGSILAPASGGVDMEIFYPSEMRNREHFPVTVINPRGFRSYVRNDTFFKAIPLVLKERPDVRFVCPGMAGEAQAQKWTSELGIGEAVDLMPLQSYPVLAALFRRAQIEVSVSTHDGTPNSLVQAMACGCFPIAGDIESIREWITPGVNGMLVDPGNPAGLAQAILKAIAQPELRMQALERNLQLVRERAEYGECMHRAEAFYEALEGKVN